MKKRSKFSLSHYRLLSCRMGEIVPIGLTEVLPGDTLQHSTSLFLRVAPLVTPVMHPVHITIHHWYVPLRLLWKSFEDFITGGPDGMDTHVVPWSISARGESVGQLGDYLGLPTWIPGMKHNILPFRAYALIYNECYRDQDLEPEIGFSDDDADVNEAIPGFGDHTTNRQVLRCDWARDYFTTARPWPQKGPQVTVPVNSPGDRTLSVVPSSANTPFQLAFQSGDTDAVTLPTQYNGTSNPGSLTQWPANPQLGWNYTNTNDAGAANLLGGGVFWPQQTGLTVDVSSPSGDLGSIDINQLREAFALQRFEEHRALYGSRYVEYLRYLGVRSSDARLQRPEYLGGSKQTLQFSEVLQTAEGTDPVGTLRGHGIGATRTPRYRRFFEEHGYVMTLLMVRPVSVYMQGMPRLWSRKVKEDFFQRELQHIGQQEVYTSEVFAGDGKGPVPEDEVFGYQNRYDEYRWHESGVSGEFRTVLDSWHMARKFANKPVLNADFINSVPTNRIYASTDTDPLYCMVNHSIQARRLMSKHGNPI